MLTTLCFVVFGGLGILVGLVAVLLKNGITHPGVTVIAVFYLAALAAVCYLLLSPVPKLIDANIKKYTGKNESPQPVLLSSPTTAQLEEHRQPAASITENTTRNLEKIPVEQD